MPTDNRVRILLALDGIPFGVQQLITNKLQNQFPHHKMIADPFTAQHETLNGFRVVGDEDIEDFPSIEKALLDIFNRGI